MIRTTHEEEKKHKCLICEESLIAGHTLWKHIKTVHKVKSTTSAQSVTKHSQGEDNLKKHIMAVHEVESNHKCIRCGKTFLLEDYIKRHIKEVHEGEKEKCTIGDQVY